jgi:hypothetical protein
LKEKFNNHRVCKSAEKKNPSGTSPNIAYTLPEKFGGKQCLTPVDWEFIKALMKDHGGEDLIRFVSLEYAQHAQTVYERLKMPKLTLENVWDVFRAMLPHM